MDKRIEKVLVLERVEDIRRLRSELNEVTNIVTTLGICNVTKRVSNLSKLLDNAEVTAGRLCKILKDKK